MRIRGIFTWQHGRYVDQIFQQIPDAIGLMVRAVRAGLPVGEAMRSVATELSSPLRDEFARMLGDVVIGRPVDQAMLKLYKRTGLTEFSFLAVTLGMQQQTGGNLAETLDNLADTVRKRVALTKRARALAAEARMQAGILMALPLVAVLAWAGLPFTPTHLRLVLPFGISFFTFETMSYTIDVYRRDLPPAKRYLDYLLFVCFFPHLVAGPIVRYGSVADQLRGAY